MNNKKRVKGAIPYSMGMISYNIEYMLIAYLSYALTESFGISAIIAGSIFLFSRFFDGASDIIAGIVIDKFNPKLGKARVYDLLHIPLWLCLILVFSVPNVGTTGKVIWVFVFYNILQSCIGTFMNIAEPLRLKRSFKDDARVKVMAVTSMLSMAFTFIASMSLPVLIDIFSKRPHGWTIISIIFAVPFSICGIMRFVLLPELPELQKPISKVDTPSLMVSLKALFQNKYALLYGGVMISWAMYNAITIGSTTYYFKYVYGNISASSIFAFCIILTIPFISMIPKFIERYGKINTVRLGLSVTVVCQLLKLLMPTNIVWLALLQLCSLCGIITLSFMKPLITIDCITYGKWRTGNSVEAIYSTVNSFSDKLGLGLGGFALGAILQLGGYNGSLLVQSDSAIFTIKMLYTAIPSMLMLIALIFFAFYNLDKKIPAIQMELENDTKVIEA